MYTHKQKANINVKRSQHATRFRPNNQKVISNMLYYLWAHSIYHLMRWFPRNNRVKIGILLSLLTLTFLAAHFVILTRDHSTRFCGQSLFPLLIVSIVFTFFMIGFSFLFCLMEHVPDRIKLVFHGFGGITFILGLVHIIFTSQAAECRVTTAELYYWSLAMAIITGLCLLYFLILVPFWIMNRIWKNSVLDRRSRTGICYEPTSCCTCVWHI